MLLPKPNFYLFSLCKIMQHDFKFNVFSMILKPMILINNNPMKKIITNSYVMIFPAFFVMLTSCISSQSFMPVKGNGTSVDKNFNLSDFHGIEVSGGFDVMLVQGNTEGVTLTAQENLFEYITVKVEQGTLKIYTEENITATNPLKARISLKSIDNLKVSGGGDVISETPVNASGLGIEISGGGDFTAVINAAELNCHISGGGDAKIDGNIKNYKIDMSGGGDLTLKSNEKVADANIEVSGGGDTKAEMNVDKLKCSISGGGDATLTGQAAELEIDVNGGGDVNAGNLATITASIQASGGSDIHVNASKEITGRISGGGDVYYAGSPENVSIEAKGGSEIHME
jgi:hypothetical protein